MNKKLIIFVVLLLAFVLSAVSPWPAILRIWNFTGGNVYLRLKYAGEQKYFLTATPGGNSDAVYLSTFEVTRRRYSAEVTACDTTTTMARLNMEHNVRLTFTGCESMKQFWTPKYWGEPTMEKPNFWMTEHRIFGAIFQHVPENDYRVPHGGTSTVWNLKRYRFQYDVGRSMCTNDSMPWPSVPDWCG